MTISVDIFPAGEVNWELEAQWNALVVEDSNSLLGLDCTARYEWFRALVDAFPEAAEAQVVVAREGSELVGLLPVIVGQDGLLGVRLLAITEHYCGRCGPLLKDQRSEVFVALIEALEKAWPGWISLQMTLVERSGNARAVIEAASDRYPAICGPGRPSPFFPLRESSEAFRNGVSKSVHQLLRTARNKFAKLGPMHFREYIDGRSAGELLDVVLAVDRQSWKHAAGSAISRQPRQEKFYRSLFTHAMESQLLRAEVLFLRDEPIAYNFGLLCNQVYSCLKHSHAENYDKLSPVYLVNESLFAKLRGLGVRTFDFMGDVEPHKLRWSDQNGTYRRNTWVFFNRSTKARTIAFAQKQKAKLKIWLSG